MATSTIKQGIRALQVAKRLIKPSYTGLNELELKFIKASEKLEQADKDLNGRTGFYATCPRLNGAVNWSAMSEREIEYFEFVNKKYESARRSFDRIVEKHNLSELDQQKIFNLYKQHNCHSASF
jgi:hypothetical protein